MAQSLFVCNLDISSLLEHCQWPVNNSKLVSITYTIDVLLKHMDLEPIWWVVWDELQNYIDIEADIYTSLIESN